jgi:hypothetical protein
MHGPSKLPVGVQQHMQSFFAKSLRVENALCAHIKFGVKDFFLQVAR